MVQISGKTDSDFCYFGCASRRSGFWFSPSALCAPKVRYFCCFAQILVPDCRSNREFWVLGKWQCAPVRAITALSRDNVKSAPGKEGVATTRAHARARKWARMFCHFVIPEEAIWAKKCDNQCNFACFFFFFLLFEAPREAPGEPLGEPRRGASSPPCSSIFGEAPHPFF